MKPPLGLDGGLFNLTPIDAMQRPWQVSHVRDHLARTKLPPIEHLWFRSAITCAIARRRREASALRVSPCSPHRSPRAPSRAAIRTSLAAPSSGPLPPESRAARRARALRS